MHDFEKHLLKNGFEQYRYCHRTKKLVKPESYELSSMSNTDYRYIRGDEVIIFGLNEKGMPPSIVYPRPSNIKDLGNGFVEYSHYRDSQMLELMHQLSNEDLLNKILTNFNI